ncbi:MAG: 50S ribosomal protein L25 [Hespellia sp.]|nr:50S ribosomal protein L25 [Hespellia sp.]
MNTLKAEKRDMKVKAKKLRREGYVTGNLFGRKIENSIPVKMLKKEVDQLLKTDNKGSQIMLHVDGQAYNVLIKEIDFNPLAGRVDEIDFQALISDEKVRSVAEVTLLNHDKLAEGVVQQNLQEISYSALPAALVDRVEIDLADMKIGDIIKVKDLAMAKNKDVELHCELEAVVIAVNAAHVQEEAEDTEEEPAEEPAE